LKRNFNRSRRKKEKTSSGFRERMATAMAQGIGKHAGKRRTNLPFSGRGIQA